MSRKFVLLILIILGISGINVLYIPPVNAWTPVEGHITQDTTWTIADSPYRAINDVTVDAGVLLTIEPGVEVQFADGFSLIVEGTLYALGETGSIVKFTSSNPSPHSGIWNTIKFTGNESESFRIEYSIIEYAVFGITSEGPGSVVIKYSTIANCSSDGVVVKDVTYVVITNNIVRNCGNNGVFVARDPISGHLVVEDNVASYNLANGFYFDSGQNIQDLTISDNLADHNSKDGIRLEADGNLFNVSFYNNSVINNMGDGLEIYSHSNIFNVSISYCSAINNAGNGFYLYEYNSAFDILLFRVTTSSNQANGISIRTDRWNSHFYNVTIQEAKVYFNYNDGIRINNDGYTYNVSIFDNKIYSNTHGIYQYTYYVRDSDFSYITNNTISSGFCGIHVLHSKTIIENNSVSYNSLGVRYYYSTSNRASFNDIYSNLDYGMYVEGSTVNAEYNYWGHSSGPFHESINPEGQGDRVNGDGINLDFWPPKTAPIGYINQRPTAVLNADKGTVNINETVSFDASNSTDDGRLDYYFFDFGDGTTSGWTTLSVVKHRYTEEGVYNVTLIVMDDFGVTSLDGDLVYVEITVVPEFPSLIILPLSMIATLLAVMLYKEKQHRP